MYDGEREREREREREFWEGGGGRVWGSLGIVCDECLFDARKKNSLANIRSAIFNGLNKFPSLRQIQNDLDQGVIGAVPIPLDYVGKELVIASLVANVEAMIRADRKVTVLKQLEVILL